MTLRGRRGDGNMMWIIIGVILAIIIVFFAATYVLPQIWNLIKSALAYLGKMVGLS